MYRVCTVSPARSGPTTSRKQQWTTKQATKDDPSYNPCKDKLINLIAFTIECPLENFIIWGDFNKALSDEDIDIPMYLEWFFDEVGCFDMLEKFHNNCPSTYLRGHKQIGYCLSSGSLIIE